MGHNFFCVLLVRACFRQGDAAFRTLFYRRADIFACSAPKNYSSMIGLGFLSPAKEDSLALQQPCINYGAELEPEVCAWNFSARQESFECSCSEITNS